ncbi:MAG: hypothetical protein ABH829_05280 [archaeon]
MRLDLRLEKADFLSMFNNLEDLPDGFYIEGLNAQNKERVLKEVYGTKGERKIVNMGPLVKKFNESDSESLYLGWYSLHFEDVKGEIGFYCRGYRLPKHVAEASPNEIEAALEYYKSSLNRRQPYTVIVAFIGGRPVGVMETAFLKDRIIGFSIYIAPRYRSSKGVRGIFVAMNDFALAAAYVQRKKVMSVHAPEDEMREVLKEKFGFEQRGLLDIEIEKALENVLADDELVILKSLRK